MIGKPLSERSGLGPLKPDRAVAILTENLAPNAAALVQVRAQHPRMVACLVVRAGKAAVRLCLELGLAMRPGGTGVVGFMGLLSVETKAGQVVVVPAATASA